VTNGKTIAILLQSISGVSAINSLVAFYDIHGGEREVLLFYYVPDSIRNMIITPNYINTYISSCRSISLSILDLNENIRSECINDIHPNALQMSD
jgi:hypothetical protein